MIFWIVAGLLAAFAVGAVVHPLMRPRPPGPSAAEADLAVYRDQLAELDRDRARGVIGAVEAEAARAEVARRMLKAADAAAATAQAAVRPRRTLGIALMAGAPLAAVALYLTMGNPGLPGAPYAERVAAAQERMAEDERLIAQLREAVAGRPDDVRGWTLLARVERERGRFAESAEAWRRVAALTPEDPAALAAFAEASTLAEGGRVGAEARDALERAAALRPDDPLVRFLLAEVKAQAGETAAAVAAWTALLADSPPGAPWVAPAQARLAALQGAGQGAGQGNAEPGPTAADVAAAQAMDADDQAAMIRGMVDGLEARLAAAPDDVEGWLRLGRSRLVLGEPDKAATAYLRALDLAPDRAEVREGASAVLARLPADAPARAELERRLSAAP